MGVENQASIVAILGGSGSGKSTSLKHLIKTSKPPRLLVWDFMREYGEFGQVFIGEILPLVHQVEAKHHGKFACVFQPKGNKKQIAAQFDIFCQLAYEAGDCVVVVEELKHVTSPSYAPQPWALISTTGRHKGLRVIGTSQRPASIDKDFLGNCTHIRAGRFAYPEDGKIVASAMRIRADEIPNAPLEYIERDMQTGDLSRGRIIFKGDKPIFSKL